MSDKLDRLRAELAFAEAAESKWPDYDEARSAYVHASQAARIVYEKIITNIPEVAAARTACADAQDAAYKAYNVLCAKIKMRNE